MPKPRSDASANDPLGDPCPQPLAAPRGTMGGDSDSHTPRGRLACRAMTDQEITWWVWCHPLFDDPSEPMASIWHTRDRAEAHARLVLEALQQRQLDIVATVIISRESGWRRPATESDGLYVAGRWNPATARLEDEGGNPLTL